MEGIAIHRYSASTVELCCQILSSLKIMNSTCDLRVTVPFPVMDMRSSGPHLPLAAVGLCMGTEARSPALATRARTPTPRTASGPSRLLPGGLSPSASTSSASTTRETAPRTISHSTTDPALTLHPTAHIVAQTLT